MKNLKKYKLKRKRKKRTHNIQKKKGKVASKRLISRKEGRLTRAKDYSAVFYFLLGIIFLTIMIFSVLGII